MKKYFNVFLEFNHSKIESTILNIANSQTMKGYCCFVDLNSLVNANKNPDILKVINEATINSCDGSYIALAASRIHKVGLKEYIGPDLFEKFIYLEKKHLIIGNTEQVFNKIKEKVEEEKKSDISYLSLPFKKVDEFDYEEIASFVNKLNPDFMWVSLGAPKQEQFMNKLVRELNRGVLIGVGAATNYFSGEIRDIPKWTRRLHVIWIYRIFTEPRKQIQRMAQVFFEFPKIYREELKLVKHAK